MLVGSNRMVSWLWTPDRQPLGIRRQLSRVFYSGRWLAAPRRQDFTCARETILFVYTLHLLSLSFSVNFNNF